VTVVGGVPRSGEQIQAALVAFVGGWKNYQGSEKGEAQTFLNQLFACYGTDRNAVGAKFEDFRSSAGFMDLHWPQVCIIEMKAPSRAKSLYQAREQVMRYWRESADGVNDLPAARYVVLCAFQRFEVWEPGRFPASPRISFDIEELPDRYESLMFLAAPALAPSFVDHYRELTKEATASIALLYQSLKDRSAAPIDEIQRFTLQCVWSLFAEDLGMLDGYPLQNIVHTLRQDPTRSSAAEIGMFFRVLNQKGDHNRQGVLTGTRYVNGELFAQPAEVNLNQDELALIATAAEHDWRKVDPTIFGSLMEGVLGRDRRWELGAHYTHEVDILKIVEPTIVRPWQRRIDGCTSPTQARELLDELCSFRVLDPACGCGNFLYVAYRELRLPGASAQNPDHDARSWAGGGQTAWAVAVLPAVQHAGHRHRADRGAHCTGHAVDGAPTDDRPLRRRRAGAAVGRPVQHPGRRCAEHPVARDRCHRREPTLFRLSTHPRRLRRRLRRLAQEGLRRWRQGLLHLLVPQGARPSLAGSACRLGRDQLHLAEPRPIGVARLHRCQWWHDHRCDLQPEVAR